MSSTINCLVLPLRRAVGASSSSSSSASSSLRPAASWLWSSWETTKSGSPVALRSVADTDLSLESRFELLSSHLTSSLWTKFITRWRDLETAPPGSLKNGWYRFIVNVVLKREDPRESFLKSIPLDNGILDVTYPDHLPEKLVRRRLRLLAMQGRQRHRRGIMLWSLAFIPQMPLMVMPLPNISVYYTLYRIYSHVRALKGSFMLGHGFSALDAKQLVDLREQLSEYDDLEPGSWPHKLVTGDRSYREFFKQVFVAHNKRRLELRLAAMLHRKESAKASGDAGHDSDSPGSPGYIESAESAESSESSESFSYLPSTSEGKPPPGHVAILDTGLKLYFAPSSMLREMLEADRSTDDIISDETVAALSDAFEAPSLADSVSRARLFFKKKRHL